MIVINIYIHAVYVCKYTYLYYMIFCIYIHIYIHRDQPQTNCKISPCQSGLEIHFYEYICFVASFHGICFAVFWEWLAGMAKWIPGSIQNGYANIITSSLNIEVALHMQHVTSCLKVHQSKFQIP